MGITIDTTKCLQCGGCVSVCPVACLELKESGIVCEQKKCVKCRNCVNFCPAGAIELK
jgi:NAD-dependent dihydropyrimidine dehydrogenase PreA subunit